MSNMEKTPRKTVDLMYQDYQNWVPVVVIAKKYGVSLGGVYFLFERENLPRDRREKMRKM